MTLQMEYFVLKPSGTSQEAIASRKAMRAYAEHLGKSEDHKEVDYAYEVMGWLSREEKQAFYDRLDAAQEESSRFNQNIS